MAIQATRVRIELFATANYQSSKAPLMRIILTPPDQVSWEEFFFAVWGQALRTASRAAVGLLLCRVGAKPGQNFLQGGLSG